MHAADVTQTVHYLLFKTGVAVSRQNTNQLKDQYENSYAIDHGNKIGLKVFTAQLKFGFAKVGLFPSTFIFI